MTEQTNKDRGHKVTLLGGGSGGHVVPLLAVAEKLLAEGQNVDVMVVTDRSYYSRTVEIFEPLICRHPEKISIKKIYSGKFRRYSGSKLKQVADLPTQVKNLLDLVKIIMGYWQSVILVHRFKPDVVFCKGGAVAIPYGYAARRRSTIVVHDSDSRPGIANRVVGKWAAVILKGLPNSVDDIDSEDRVGVPVRSVNINQDLVKLKNRLGLSKSKKIVLCTGGGLGAESLNRAVSKSVGSLLKAGFEVVHQTGTDIDEGDSYGDLDSYYHQFRFCNNLIDYMLVADIVISRAGATALQELANLKKVIILVPANLTDQTKNAKMVESLGGCRLVVQRDLDSGRVNLFEEVENLFKDEAKMKSLSRSLSKLGKRDAADEITDVIRGYLK